MNLLMVLFFVTCGTYIIRQISSQSLETEKRGCHFLWDGGVDSMVSRRGCHVVGLIGGPEVASSRRSVVSRRGGMMANKVATNSLLCSFKRLAWHGLPSIDLWI
jgi:hypothetical protein